MNAGTQSIMDSLQEQGAFFDVRTEKVKTESGIVIPGKKVHVRADDGTPLGVTSTKYRTVTTREQLEQFAVALDSSSIKLDGASADVNFSHNGARTMVQFRFPEHVIFKGEKNESILEIICRNSYDGRWNFTVQGGACRMACLNGMLLGDWLAGYREYHNSKLDIGLAASKVVSMIDAFGETETAWSRMLKAEITDDKAWRIFCLYTGKDADFKRGLAAYREAERKTGTVKLMDQYEAREKPELGSNAFAAYNTLTHHATHANLREGKEASGLALRQGKVADVLTSKYWRERVCAESA